MIRFADDVIVTARSRGRAELIMQAVMEFLADRGLKINYEKSRIADVKRGFDFLSRHYQRRNGVLYTHPSGSSIKEMERKLESTIVNFKGSQRNLIHKVNGMLSGWAAYHRVEDSYMEFRHIDAIVDALLIRKMCEKYPNWSKEAVSNRFWRSAWPYPIFALPNDASVRVKRLAPIPIKEHKPCMIKYNPFDWEAGMYKSFWFDTEPGMTSPMWQEEGYPIHAVNPSNRDYCIYDSWLSQCYEIKALHLAEKRVVFRRTENYKSGLRVPKALTEQKLPDRVVYECEQFFKEIIYRYGL